MPKCEKAQRRLRADYGVRKFFQGSAADLEHLDKDARVRGLTKSPLDLALPHHISPKGSAFFKPRHGRQDAPSADCVLAADAAARLWQSCQGLLPYVSRRAALLLKDG